MKLVKSRNLVFLLHCYIGLAIGLVAIVIGLTGSLLVFRQEMSDIQLRQQFGTIVPQGEPLPIEIILNTVKTTYANQPDTLLKRLYRWVGEGRLLFQHPKPGFEVGDRFKLQQRFPQVL
ncbi:MAG: PepSY domain-containing protein [Leptolyngbyaceae cyanobacterium RU_5_1]|nr:PepSY domain-containing protein [Leptolyngbyaceae cyanobacterium RU_5_1]